MTMPDGEPTVNDGLRLLKQGDAARATAVLEHIVARNPDNGQAFQFLGIARAQTGDEIGGVQALQEAARLLPENAAVFYNLGVALGRLNQTEAARQALERAVALDPANAKAQSALESLLPAAAPAPSLFTPAPPPPPTPTLSTPPSSLPDSPSALPTAAPEPILGASRLAPPPAPVSSSGAGMHYTPVPPVNPESFSREPTAGERIGRGLGWGFLCGQWWTLLMFVWAILIPSLRPGNHASVANFVIELAIFFFLFGFVGAVCGLIIGATNAKSGIGAGIGAGAGMLLMACELYLDNFDPKTFINIFFWFFTGRYVGANIVRRVQARVEK